MPAVFLLSTCRIFCRVFQTFFFAFFIAIIGCYQGFDQRRYSGRGHPTTRTVVIVSMMVVVDFFLTRILR